MKRFVATERLAAAKRPAKCLTAVKFLWLVALALPITARATGFPEGLAGADSAFLGLRFPSDSLALENFYNKLDTLLLEGRGQLNIVHIGGSHVQAGVLTYCLQRHFRQLSPNESHAPGFVFPYRAAKTNNPVGYRVDCEGEWTYARKVASKNDTRLGMSAIALMTADTAAAVSLRLNPDSAGNVSFCRLCLLGREDSAGWEPVVQVAGWPFSDSLPPFATADEIRGSYDSTIGGWQFDTPPADALRIGFRRREVLPENSCDTLSFTLTGILASNDEPGITCHALGVNGASLGTYLRCEDFGRDLRLLRPDLVIYGIGINDAVQSDFTQESFVARYDSVLTQFQAVNPACCTLFLTNNDSFVRRTKANSNGLQAREAFYRMAGQYGAALWDVFSLMGGLGSARQWEQAGLMKPDKIHFTNAGYELLGDLLFQALMDDYARHTQRKGL